MTTRTSFFAGGSVSGKDSQPGVAGGGAAPEARPRDRSGEGQEVTGRGNGREDEASEDGGGERVEGETAEGRPGEEGGDREGAESPPGQRESGHDDRPGNRRESEERVDEPLSRTGARRPVGHAQPDHDPEQIPVEDAVHQRGQCSHVVRLSSRARPYPRAIDAATLFVILLFALLVVPAVGQRVVAMRRSRALGAFQRARGTRVIVMIHRQETVGFLGVPLVRYIDIDDSEAALRAIRLTPDETPIDLILHTPGGLVLASEQIAYALKAHPAKVTVLVPHYAMSGGTLLALAADEILMDDAAVLGPVDPQLGDMPAASLVRVAAKKPTERLDDRTLVMADVAEKALRHMKQVVRDLVIERLGAEKADSLAEELAGGHYTHDDPITVPEAKALGLAVTVGLPTEAYELMELFPQAAQRRPSVQFVPLPMPPGDPTRRTRGA